MQNNFTSLNGSIHSLFNQRFSFKHLAALVASVLVILCAVWLPYALFWQLDGLLNLQQAQIIGSTMFYGGIASFVAIAVVTRFRLSKDWSLKRNVGLFSILLLTTLVFSSLLSAPVVAALTPLPSDTGPNNSSAYKFSVPFTEYQWIIAQFRDGTYYAINGSDWNILTIVEPWQPVAPWAALASNLTALEEQVLASTTSGKILLNEVTYNYNLTIPANVTVIESYNGLTRQFINSANTQGSPYTISVDTVQDGYYLAQDSADRFIDEWSSPDAKIPINNALATSEPDVYLTSGTYIYNTTDGEIIVNQTNTKFGGAKNAVLQPYGNKGAVQIHRSGTGYTGEPLSGIEVYGFEIDGSNLNQTVVFSDLNTVARKGIHGQYITNSSFHDLYIHHTPATNLGIDYLIDVNIYNNICDKSGNNGIGIATGWTSEENFKIYKNTISNGDINSGVVVENSGENGVMGSAVVEDNTITNYKNGVGNFGGYNVKVVNNIISFCQKGYVEDNFTRHFVALPHDNEIVGNTFLNCSNSGIGYYTIAGMFERDIIANNKMFGCARGLVLYNCSNFLVSNNLVSYSDMQGIVCWNTDNTKFIGNTGINNGCNKTIGTEHGINLRDNCHNNTLTGNTWQDNRLTGKTQKVGICFGTNNVGNVVLGDTCIGNSVFPIQIQNANTVETSFSNCVIWGSPDDSGTETQYMSNWFNNVPVASGLPS